MDTSLFRTVLGRFATGITVVTTLDHNGDPVGLTVNSLASVSLEPPLILVCIDLDAESHDPLVASDGFAVNILSATQRGLAETFASKQDRETRWGGLEWTAGWGGAPIFEGIIGVLQCEVWKTVEAGDHTVILGQVMDASVREGDPLLYYGGGFRWVAD